MNDQLQKLREKILLFNKAYEQGNPLVSDDIYDFYKKKLCLLEQNENVKISDSIGISASNSMPHMLPILSLEHNFGKDSIELFIKKIQKITDPFPLIGELKIDGVSLIASYENGEITALKTRGNGIAGENISHLIDFINIPEKIYIKEKIEIRFEAYLNKDQAKNPRNATAGMLLKKNIDPKLAFINLAPHNLYSHEKLWNSYSELLEIFKKLHLSIITPSATCYSLNDCIAYFNQIEALKKDFKHEIDGIVFKVNDKNKQNLLGSTAKAPRHSFAIKFSNSFNITEITDILYQVGRQGRITPLAIVTETNINNRKITKATLNNLKDLEKKQYAIGDIVKIEMAGEVIPKISEIIEKSNNKTNIPLICPSCNNQLEGEYCLKGWECYEQKLNRLIYFASKQCLDIKNLGESQIKFFVDQQILDFPYDFFEIKHNISRIKENPSWLAEKSFAKMIESIEKSKYVSLEKFITSLGLPNIAATKAKEIAKSFITFEKFINAKEEDLIFLGAKNAQSIIEYVKNEKNWIEKTAEYMKIGQTYAKYSLFDMF